MQNSVNLAFMMLSVSACAAAGLAGAADLAATSPTAVAAATPAPADAPAATGGDAAAGRRAFNRSCRSCHQVETGTGSELGPNLAGILGRAARADSAFEYSDAFAAAAARGTSWDAATLERFLAAPTTMIPGTTMPMAVGDPAQRRDLVAYLATLSP